MTKLGLWLGMGMTLLGVQDMAAAPGAQSADDTGDPQSEPLLGGYLLHTRILYPLQVGEWSATTEHLYDDPAYGVSIRYAHGEDLDRWIDLYFYPAGRLTPRQFSDAAHEEADGIRSAHRDAGSTAVDMGALQPFSPGGHVANADGVAMELGFTCDDVAYSSAMTLTLDRLYFVKARYSIEQDRLSRQDTLQQLQVFVRALQPRLSLRSVLSGASTPVQLDGDAGESTRAGDLREIRLDYRAEPRLAVHTMVA
jgi:hypothetical protein